MPGDSWEGEEDGSGGCGGDGHRGGGRRLRRRTGQLVRFGGRLRRGLLQSRGATGLQPQGHTPVLRGDVRGTGVVVLKLIILYLIKMFSGNVNYIKFWDLLIFKVYRTLLLLF